MRILLAISFAAIVAIVAMFRPTNEVTIDIPEELVPLLKDERAVDLVGTYRNDTLFIEFITDEDR